MAVLDWSGRDGARHWGGGALRPCRDCGQPALLLGDDGRPQHKTCAELELAAAAARALVPDPEITQPDLEAEALG